MKYQFYTGILPENGKVQEQLPNMLHLIYLIIQSINIVIMQKNILK